MKFVIYLNHEVKPARSNVLGFHFISLRSVRVSRVTIRFPGWVGQTPSRQILQVVTRFVAGIFQEGSFANQDQDANILSQIDRTPQQASCFLSLIPQL